MTVFAVSRVDVQILLLVNDALHMGTSLFTCLTLSIKLIQLMCMRVRVFTADRIIPGPNILV